MSRVAKVICPVGNGKSNSVTMHGHRVFDEPETNIYKYIPCARKKVVKALRVKYKKEKTIKKTIHINLFGGPSTGKSRTATRLFSYMKAKGCKVEYAPEFAKDVTYDKSSFILQNQLFILANQHHKTFRLEGEVDYVIHDSPFVMGLVYLNPNKQLLPDSYQNFVLDLHNQYESINILLKRDDVKHPYQTYGRSQTLAEAIEKDTQISTLLKTSNIKYTEITASKKAFKKIHRLLDKV